MTSVQKRRPLATPEDVSAFLNLPTETLRNWRSRHIGPIYTKVGHLVRYDWADVEAWLAENRKSVA